MDEEGIGHDAKTARKIKNNCQGTLRTMESMGNNQQNQERSKVNGATVGENTVGCIGKQAMFGSAMNQFAKSQSTAESFSRPKKLNKGKHK